MSFLRQPTVVPTAVLSTGDGLAGLKGEYFSGENLAGTPQVVRVDKAVDVRLFNKDPSALTPPPGMKDFSARCTGFLPPPELGRFEIGLTGSLNHPPFHGQLLLY